MAGTRTLSLPRFLPCPCGSGVDSRACQAERGFLRACDEGCGRGFHPSNNAQKLCALCRAARQRKSDAASQKRRRDRAKAAQ